MIGLTQTVLILQRQLIMLLKKLLSALLPTPPQPNNADSSDDVSDNPLGITPMEFTIRPGFGRQYISNGIGETEIIDDE